MLFPPKDKSVCFTEQSHKQIRVCLFFKLSNRLVLSHVSLTDIVVKHPQFPDTPHDSYKPLSLSSTPSLFVVISSLPVT